MMALKYYFQIAIPILMILSFTWFAEAGLTRSDRPLRCHVCDAETCKTFNKKAEPANCTESILRDENAGPSKLYELSTIKFSPLDSSIPLFACQKIEGYDKSGNLNVVRRCQVRTAGNESCAFFYKRNAEDQERSYHNVSCSTCETDGCNSGATVYMWISLLFGSAICSILI